MGVENIDFPLSLPLAITMGDPAGICPELTVRAWQELHHKQNAPVFFAIDDPENLSVRSHENIPVQIIHHPREAVDVFSHALPVLPEVIEGGANNINVGHPNLKTAASTIRSITRAVDLVQTGQAGGIVTNPITKKVLYEGAGFKYPGHTEFLAALCHSSVPPVMMLAGNTLRVVPATIHIPVQNIARTLNTLNLLHTIEVVHTSLRQQFSIDAPRITVSGLNPHAGEGGTIGSEENALIMPAILQAQARDINVTGCFPADTMFYERMRETYDCAICMYHDQALIPIKMLHFDTAVNVTLGLTVVRTSPDHGTAYDIAGTGMVRIQSFLNAIEMAHSMAKNAKVVL